MSIGTERGYAEIYQYIKLFWITIILAWATLKKQQAVYAVGTLVFFYILLDDSFQIHETGGRYIIEWANLVSAFGLRAQDYGELGVYAFTGVLFLTAGWLSYRHSNALAREISLYVLSGLFVLGVFAAGVDMLHSLLGASFRGRIHRWRYWKKAEN